MDAIAIFYDKIDELNSSYYNITDRIASNHHYGIISYNVKEDTFIIIDSRRTKLYDSRVGFLEIKALSSKMKL